MAVVGMLDWQSNVAVGAANDATAVRNLISALGALPATAARGGPSPGAGEAAAERSAARAAAIEARRVQEAQRAAEHVYQIRVRYMQAEEKAEAKRAREAEKDAEHVFQIRRRFMEAEQKAEEQKQKVITATAKREAEKRAKELEKYDKETRERQKDIGESIEKMVYDWSKAIARETASFLATGEKLAIAETSSREAALIRLEGLLGSHAAAQETYDKLVKLSYDIGATREDTLSKMNRLIAAGFGEADALTAIRTVGDATQVLGRTTAEKLSEALIKIQNVGKLTSRDLLSLRTIPGAMAGTFEELSRMLGKSRTEIEAMAKHGQISADVAIKAIEAAIEKRIGGQAVKLGATLPRIYGDVKTDVERLFEDIDLSPAKEALTNVFELFRGPEGIELKASVKDLFDTLTKTLFDPFKGPEGRARLAQIFTTAAAAARVLADGLRAVAPLIERIVSLMDKLGKSATAGTLLSDISFGLRGAVGLVSQRELGTRAHEAATAALTTPGGGTIPIGKGMADGVAQGIREGTPGVLAAMHGLVGATVDQGKSSAKVRSPSELFADELGYQISAGVAVGMGRGFGLVTSASAAMVNAARASAGGAAVPGMGENAGGMGEGGIHVHGDVKVYGVRDMAGFERGLRVAVEHG